MRRVGGRGGERRHKGSGYHVVKRGWVLESEIRQEVSDRTHVLHDKFPLNKITLGTGDCQVSSDLTQARIPGSEGDRYGESSGQK